MISRSFAELISRFVLAALLLTSVSAFPVQAQEEKPVEDIGKAETEEGKPEGYQLQRLDDPALPTDPIELRTEEIQKKLEAQSWYMTGWLFKQREKYRDAMAAFEKATLLSSILRAMSRFRRRATTEEELPTTAVLAVEKRRPKS